MVRTSFSSKGGGGVKGSGKDRQGELKPDRNARVSAAS